MAYFLRKMILAKTWYKTHNSELLAIVKAFKTWRHYLDVCKHKVFVLIDWNNFQKFIDTNNLGSRQVCWAQEHSRYHFWIDYCQRKANETAEALSRFPGQDDEEKGNLWAENTQILYCLQFLLINVSISGLITTFLGLSPQHQVLICRTYALPQLRRF